MWKRFTVVSFRPPYMPTISEIRQHKTTHLPYRSWYDECVEAFARKWPHLHREGPSKRTIPVIHMGYACLTEKSLFKQIELSAEDREHAVRVIVVYCSGSRSLHARGPERGHEHRQFCCRASG